LLKSEIESWGLDSVDAPGIPFVEIPELVVADVGARQDFDIHPKAIRVDRGLIVFQQSLLGSLVDGRKHGPFYGIPRIAHAKAHLRVRKSYQVVIA
jgi:hypothetical protein